MRKKLKDVCDFYSGTGFPTQYQGRTEGEYPFYKVGDIAQNAATGKVYLELCNNYISEDIAKTIKGCILPKDTVVFAKIGEALKLNRRAITSCDCLIDNNVMGIAPKSDFLRIQYFYFFMKNLKIQTLAESTTVPSVRKTVLENYEIEVLSLDAQKEIENKLAFVQKIIEKRKQELFALDNIIKARFVEMFGDPYVNPLKWKKLKIKDAVTVEPQNGLYKPQSDYVTDGSGIPILRIDGFYDGMVTDFASLKRLKCSETEKQKYVLLEDDVVINRVNSIEYLGKCAHIKGFLEDTVYESNMMRMHFDPEYYNPVYICKLLCNQFIYDQIVNHAKKAVNQASINQKDVLDFNIYQPPIDLQNQFADFARQVNKSKVAVM